MNGEGRPAEAESGVSGRGGEIKRRSDLPLEVGRNLQRIAWIAAPRGCGQEEVGVPPSPPTLSFVAAPPAESNLAGHGSCGRERPRRAPSPLSGSPSVSPRRLQQRRREEGSLLLGVAALLLLSSGRRQPRRPSGGTGRTVGDPDSARRVTLSAPPRFRPLAPAAASSGAPRETGSSTAPGGKKQHGERAQPDRRRGAAALRGAGELRAQRGAGAAAAGEVRAQW